MITHNKSFQNSPIIFSIRPYAYKEEEKKQDLSAVLPNLDFFDFWHIDDDNLMNDLLSLCTPFGKAKLLKTSSKYIHIFFVKESISECHFMCSKYLYNVSLLSRVYDLCTRINVFGGAVAVNRPANNNHTNTYINTQSDHLSVYIVAT